MTSSSPSPSPRSADADLRIQCPRSSGKCTRWTVILFGLSRAAVAAVFGGGMLIGTLPGHAQNASPSNSGSPKTETSEEGFLSSWLNMVSRTQAQQPNWVTPLATNNSILTQSFHYDVLSERLPNGTYLNSYGGGKGLEFIPFPGGSARSPEWPVRASRSDKFAGAG